MKHRQAAASKAEYRTLDNRVTCLLAWPPHEISAWVQMLQGHQQQIACSILRRRHPRPTQLNLPAIGEEVPDPFQVNRPTVPVTSADGRLLTKVHAVPGLTPVVIDVDGTIRCVNTGRTLWIAPGSRIDRANPGASEQRNSLYKPSLHQVVADHRQHVDAVTR
ncbi:hypothetical protein [Aeromonas sp. BIGb0445]|uniref:hypothetical protein n=1 Tax=Aeromonas sp. BIGb0445 TaxID=2940593 RepID=UPI002169EB57|nr:hypothetical protein [Aeromonas sp. BIGb0445]MCS3460224.1 hypothetical protein [Aeromonas sp. BIGb0445]